MGETEILIVIEEIIEVEEEIEILGVEVGVEIGPDLNSKIEGHLIDQEVEALHNLLDLKHRRIGDVTTANEIGHFAAECENKQKFVRRDNTKQEAQKWANQMGTEDMETTSGDDFRRRRKL